jgi:hypothetical protein
VPAAAQQGEGDAWPNGANRHHAGYGDRFNGGAGKEIWRYSALFGYRHRRQEKRDPARALAALVKLGDAHLAAAIQELAAIKTGRPAKAAKHDPGGHPGGQRHRRVAFSFMNTVGLVATCRGTTAVP